MNNVALAQLTESAPAFARGYVALKEALIRQGVEEEEAQDAARLSALYATYYPEDPPEPWERTDGEP